VPVHTRCCLLRLAAEQCLCVPVDPQPEWLQQAYAYAICLYGGTLPAGMSTDIPAGNVPWSDRMDGVYVCQL
jgi:hypothetical protein